MDNQTDWDCLTCRWEVPGDIAALQRRQLLGLFGLQFDCQATLQGPTRLHEFLGVFILYIFFLFERDVLLLQLKVQEPTMSERTTRSEYDINFEAGQVTHVRWGNSFNSLHIYSQFEAILVEFGPGDVAAVVHDDR